MSTYLQGVTDYIPEYQPFQPDLNFYGNLMQAKQSIYDQNYKALSNVYNQLYSAELTNKENIKNRDELLKQLDFNLNRIAGLDLSLEQNVEQAKQVFKPFYENRSLMRDMAYTKNWNNTYSSAQALKTSQDEKQRKQYWDEGIRKMQYEREAFANANLDDILNMQDSTYTPRVDVPEMYQKLAKDMDLSVDITETDGRYFVRQKNGPLLQAPLTQLFASKLNSDPAVQEYYRTKAYVNRMDNAHANKDKYGSIEEAEREYLRTNYNLLKEQVKIQNNETQEIKNNIETKLNNVNEHISKEDINEFTGEYVQSLEEALGMVTVNAEVTQKLANELDDKPSSNSISSSVGDGLDLSNIELARMKVDMGIANSYANNDINQQAYLLAHKDMIKDMSANPYGVAAEQHAYRSAEESQRAANRMNEIMARAQKQEELINLKYHLDNKLWIPDGKGGYMENPALNSKITKNKNLGSGALDADPNGLLGINEIVDKDMANYFAKEPMDMILEYIQGVAKTEKLNDVQAMEKFLGLPKGDLIMGGSYANRYVSQSTGITFDAMGGIDALRDALQKNPERFMSSQATNKKGHSIMEKLYDNAVKYANQNKGNPYHKNFLDKFTPVSANYIEYSVYVDQKNKVKEQNKIAIRNGLASSPELNKLSKTEQARILNNIIDYDGNFRTQEDFTKIMTQLYGDAPDLSASESITLARNPNLYYNLGIGQNPTTEERIDYSDIYGKIYNDLKPIYKQTVKDSNQVRSYTSLISDQAQSLLADKENGNAVFLGAPGTPGFGGFMQFAQGDYANINWEDDTENKISFFGYSKSAEDSMKQLGYDNEKVRNITDRIMGDLWSKIGDPKSPMFELTSKQFVLENSKKGAMILYPTQEILKPYLADKVISQEAYDAMLLNGISFISDRANFKNSIYTANLVTPLQAAVNSLRPGESLKKYAPGNNGYVEIQKNPFGSSDYIIDVGFDAFYDNEGNKHTNVIRRQPPLIIGNNSGIFLQNTFQTIKEASELSTFNFKNFYQSNMKK